MDIKVGDKVDITATVEVVEVHKETGDLSVKGLGRMPGQINTHIRSDVVTKVHDRPLKVGDKIRSKAHSLSVYTLVYEGKRNWFVTWGEDGEGTICKDHIPLSYERV